MAFIRCNSISNRDQTSICDKVQGDLIELLTQAPMPKYVLFGSYCADVLEKRVPHRQAHLDRLAELKAAGSLITLGPTQDLTQVFGIYEADDEAAVRQLVEADPYWQHGIWTEYQVKEWIQAF